ncbi:basic amino acid ABC transporter substrate-binding protein [Brachyspira sp.]|uniref:basic amino acid ABC transporter substrate-binding protein n=1 Tax=Brachyspira sp. TaxID=1977261 RepID=UPI003D7D5510
MKKIIAIFMIIFSLILSLSCNNKTNSSESMENTEDKIIYVGIDAAFPPFGYLDNGNIAGFDYDIMNEIAKLTDMKVEFNQMQFAGLLPALQTKKIDVIIAGMTVTEERKEFVNFSETYYVSSQVILVHRDNNDITNFDNLEGKNVGTVIGTTGDVVMTENEKVNTKKFDTGAQAVLSLKEKKIDAIVFDKEPCKNFAKYNEEIKLIDSDSVQEDYAIAVRKEDISLLENINRGISIIMTNGTYENLIEKNFK